MKRKVEAQNDQEIEECEAWMESAKEKLETAYAKKYAEEAPFPEPWKEGKEYAPPMSKKEVIAFLREADEKEGRKETRKHTRSVRRKMLAACLIAVLLAGGFSTAAYALRWEPLYSLVVWAQEVFIGIRSPTEGYDYSGYYIPQYLPPGCRLGPPSTEGNIAKVEITGEGGAFCLRAYYGDYDIKQDNESYTQETVAVNSQKDALLLTFADKKKLIWHVKPLLVLTGDASPEELVRIAESVTLIP